jgi:hypothetical protein
MTQFKVRIKNDMFGYSRDQIKTIEAKDEKKALKIAQDIDWYAEVTLVKNQNG